METFMVSMILLMEDLQATSNSSDNKMTPLNVRMWCLASTLLGWWL